MTNLTNNKAVLSWIDEMTAITKPDKIVWITGEEDQIAALREQAVEEGILIKLNPDKLPGCYLHRTDPDDVARVEDRTFICCEKEEDAGPTNHWMEPKEMYKKMYALADGAYKGRTMYIIPYSMSIIGSPFAKYGFELTDSIYVVLNMHIMTRVGKAVCDALGDDTGFIKGLHCQCNLDKDNKYIVHFPQDNTIISMNSNYGGNVLQGKKCFALRIASNLGRQEGWMAEHMLILGIQNPRGEIKYISAAFPSACGKTNLAMLIPPEGLQRWGWRVWCVGDDIAWLRVGKDGRLWAVNPENGFFGVAPGTSMKSNPNALISTHKDTIFTNVALDLSDNTVWWEPVSCFFTSHYDDPRDIDLAEFLRYCPLSTTLGDADVEEFHAVLDTLGIENAERFKVPDDWAVPVRRMPKSDVSALLMQWADITVDDLRDQEDAIYLAQYDAFYEFTSDFGPGSFIPVGGEQYGDSIRLWSAPRGENGEGTHDELTLEVRPDGSYRIEAFREV